MSFTPQYADNREDFFFDIAKRVALESKYDGTKVGSVLVKDNRSIVTHGCNGYPNGLDDDYINTLSRDERLKLVIHAEENSLLNMLEFGIDRVERLTAFVTHHPCIKCAARLKRAGIHQVKYIKNSEFEAKWIEPDRKLFDKLQMALMPIINRSDERKT